MSAETEPRRRTKITVLFDIDGTLMLTGGAGIAAMKKSVHRLFGIDQYPELEYHGRTDFGITRDLFEKLGLSFEQHFVTFRRDYHSQLRQELSDRRGYLLPGVSELLREIANDDRFSVGLLTGNAREAAAMKLEAYGIGHYFSFGGFGDYHACRNDVAREAVNDAAQSMGSWFDPVRLVVIGDTHADITCARAIRAVSVAVATGNVETSELARGNPDLLLSSLVHLSSESLANWPY